jgi:hypothetical protein
MGQVYKFENRYGKIRAITSQKTALIDPRLRVSASMLKERLPW